MTTNCPRSQRHFPWTSFIVFIIVWSIETILLATLPQIVALIVNDITTRSPDWRPAALFAVAIIGVQLLSFLDSILQAQFQRRVETSLRRQMLASLMESRRGDIPAAERAMIVTQITNVLPIVSESYYFTLVRVVMRSVQIAIFSTGMIHLDVRFFLVTVLTASIALLPPAAFRRSIGNRQIASIQALESYTSEFDEYLAGLNILRRTLVDRSWAVQVNRKSEWQWKRQMNLVRLKSASGSLIGLSILGGQLGILLVGIASIHSVSAGAIVAALQYHELLALPISALSQSLTQLGAGRRVQREFLALYPVPSCNHELTPHADSGFTSLRCDSLSVRFDNGRHLQFANFSVNRGDKVLIRGENGSGKSTLLRAICGEREVSGGMFMWSGHRKIINHSVDYVQFVSQDAFAFSRSLEENISLGRQSGQELPWFAQTISTQGELCNEHISGGERQRVALARALYSSPEVLIIDEGLSQVDWPTKAAILRALLADPDLTLIMVDHQIRDSAPFDHVVDVSATILDTNDCVEQT